MKFDSDFVVGRKSTREWTVIGSYVRNQHSLLKWKKSTYIIFELRNISFRKSKFFMW